MRLIAYLFASVAVTVGAAAIAYGTWLVTSGGYEPAARRFVGAMVILGALGIVSLGAGAAWLARRSRTRR